MSMALPYLFTHLGLGALSAAAVVKDSCHRIRLSPRSPFVLFVHVSVMCVPSCASISFRCRCSLSSPTLLSFVTRSQ